MSSLGNNEDCVRHGWNRCFSTRKTFFLVRKESLSLGDVTSKECVNKRPMTVTDCRFSNDEPTPHNSVSSFIYFCVLMGTESHRPAGHFTVKSYPREKTCWAMSGAVSKLRISSHMYAKISLEYSIVSFAAEAPYWPMLANTCALITLREWIHREAIRCVHVLRFYDSDANFSFPFSQSGS